MSVLKILCITPIQHISGLMSKLSALGHMTYIPDPDRLEALGRAFDADVIFTNPNKMRFKIDGDFLQGAPRLRKIVTASTGTNHIDIREAEARGIEVISLTTEFGIINRISSTAELAFGLTLAIVRNIPKANSRVIGEYEWDYERYIGRQLSALKVGVLGYGRLGRFYARYAAAFGSDVVFCDPAVKEEPSGPRKVELRELLETCDIISFHFHLSSETRNFVNADFLNQLKRRPYLINSARGEVVDEKAIVEALRAGQIAGYATDVIVDELSSDVARSRIIAGAREGLNIVITPHIGGMSREAQEIAYHGVADILAARLSAKTKE